MTRGRPRLNPLPPTAQEPGRPGSPLSAVVWDYDGQRLAEESDQRLFNNSIEKGMRVLHAFGVERRPLNVAEIARASGLDRSSTQRVVYTLHRLGYLRKDEAIRRYHLSSRVLDFGSAYLAVDEPAARLPRYFSLIHRRTGEFVSLNELDGAEVVVVTRLPSRRLFSFPAFCTATGRAILAFLPPNAARAVLARSKRKKLTEHTVTDLTAIERALQYVREMGYCITEQEAVAGTTALGVPIFGAGGRPVAAIEFYLPLAEWPRERIARELAPPALEAGREMSRSLGAR
jgi:IclR family transcriptional regulator, pca regulon regulatory protein